MSCKAQSYPIGMPERDFLAKTKSELIEKTAFEAVYRKTNQPFGGDYQIRYFYFQRGVLVRIDQGVRGPDLIIQHN